ncbi:MAG: signal peptidase I [Bacteroidota bacterium]
MAEQKKSGFTQSIWFKIIIGILTFGLYFLLRKSDKKKSPIREWTDAIVFAVIAATIIRTFFIEAFTIPTSSMEKSLLIGDFLFVSKVSYGPRIPNTPISFPFAHHTLPLTENTKSYSELIQLPYFRLPGFGDIKNNDIVVFNYPMEDWRPTDKKENYIKRCVAIPGDKLEVRQGVLHINDKVADKPENMQHKYLVSTDGSGFNPKTLLELDITEGGLVSGDGVYELTLTTENAAKIKGFSNVKDVQPLIETPGKYADYIFPHDSTYTWNADNYGPLVIPKEGVTVDISLKNISIYKRVIENYEKNKLEVKADGVYINGQKADKYTFKMDYYFMMGDNRHNSADSRFWGFVPIDHIVGKAVFVWLSLDPNATTFFSKFRTERLFTFISSDGLSNSYFLLFDAIILSIWGFNYYRKRKAKAKPTKK